MIFEGGLVFSLSQEVIQLTADDGLHTRISRSH